jgi:hypothetical protein
MVNDMKITEEVEREIRGWWNDLGSQGQTELLTKNHLPNNITFDDVIHLYYDVAISEYTTSGQNILDKIAYAGRLKAEANAILDEVEELAMVHITPLVDNSEFTKAYQRLNEFFTGDSSECMQKFGIVSYIFDAEESYNENQNS